MGEFIALMEQTGPAGMNVDVCGVTDAIATLVRSRVQVDPAQLANPDVPLGEFQVRPVAKPTR